jgi:hypothetical protein
MSEGSKYIVYSSTDDVQKQVKLIYTGWSKELITTLGVVVK